MSDDSHKERHEKIAAMADAIESTWPDDHTIPVKVPGPSEPTRTLSHDLFALFSAMAEQILYGWKDGKPIPPEKQDT